MRGKNINKHDEHEMEEGCSLCNEKEEDFTSYGRPIVKNRHREDSSSKKTTASLTNSESSSRQKRDKDYFWTRLSWKNKPNSSHAFSAVNLVVSCVVLLFIILGIYFYTDNLSFATKQATEAWKYINNGNIVNLTKTLVTIYNITNMAGKGYLSPPMNRSKVNQIDDLINLSSEYGSYDEGSGNNSYDYHYDEEREEDEVNYRNDDWYTTKITPTTRGKRFG
jgi:hypothetical protein